MKIEDDIATNPENALPEHVDPLARVLTREKTARYEVLCGPGVAAIRCTELGTGRAVEIAFSARDSIDYLISLLQKAADQAFGDIA